MNSSKNIKKERNHYSNQNCTNYNNYTRNANFKSEPFEGEELDDLSKLGTEYANELTFNSYYGNNTEHESKASQNKSSINNKQSKARTKSQNSMQNNQNK